MAADQPTRDVVKMLRKAGWTRVRSVGSHTTWIGPHGTLFSLADGHRTISPGVYRQLLKAMEDDQ